jgi:hypothetical protein
LAGSLKDARVGAFGKNYAFGMTLKFFCEFGDERHLRKERVVCLAAGLRAAIPMLNAYGVTVQAVMTL